MDLPYILEGLRPLAVPIGTLKPDPENARKHGKRNLEAIKASLRRFGQTKPLAVRKSDNVVIAGNGRLKVALELGWTHMAVVAMEGTPEQLKAFAVIDNQTAELAEWDDVALADALSAIAGADGDLVDDMGFNAAELDKLVDIEDPVVEEEPQDAPFESEPPKPPARAPKQAKAAPAAKPVAKATAAPGFDLTDRQQDAVAEAARLLREEKEDGELTLGECMRILASRYIKTRSG